MMKRDEDSSSTYEDGAYSDEFMEEIVERSGFRDFGMMVAALSGDGLTLTEIAARIEASPQPFMAYHAKWIRHNTKPLRLGDIE